MQVEEDQGKLLLRIAEFVLLLWKCNRKLCGDARILLDSVAPELCVRILNVVGNSEINSW